MSHSNYTVITKNAAKCLSCGTIIESKHRHDFVTCKCGKISVDGGRAYLRRMGEFGYFEELSECRPMNSKELLELRDSYVKYDYGYSSKNIAEIDELLKQKEEK